VGNNSTWMRSRPWPTSWEPSDFPLGWTVLTALGAIFCFIAPALLYMFAYIFYLVAVRHVAPSQLGPTSFPATQLLLAQLISYAPLAGYLLATTPRLSHRTLYELGFRVPGRREVGMGLVGLIAMFAAVYGASLIVAALTHRHDTEAAVALMKQLKSPFGKALFVLVVVICGPMAEELLFRVFLFNAVSRYLPVWAAAIASGAMFGLAHAAALGQILTVSIPLAFGGVVLAIVYSRSRCYWSNVITHAGFNLISVVLLFVYPNAA
jgi:uncharacterized protein